MKHFETLTGEPAGCLEDIIPPAPVPSPSIAAWKKARRTGKLKMGGVVLAEREQSNWQFKPEILRLREIERVVMDNRLLGVLPDFYVLVAVAKSGTPQKVADWCRAKAPEVSQAEVDAAIATAAGRRWMLSADECAALLGTDMEQRTRLGLRTIGATDMTKEQRTAFKKERKRERDRQRQAAKRRADGRKSQADSISKAKPWEVLGMSRPTWYRKGKPTGETTLSPLGEQNRISDKPVSLPILPTAPARTIVPAMPPTAATTTDNRLALGRAMGARGDLSPRTAAGGRK
tara:strand:+ start:3304 stop:4170 length:867 start_codon:yes stop_codon:yes gene_type:complete